MNTKYAVAYASYDGFDFPCLYGNILNERLYDTEDEAVKAIEIAIESDKEMYCNNDDDDDFEITHNGNEWHWTYNDGDYRGYYKIVNMRVNND